MLLHLHISVLILGLFAASSRIFQQLSQIGLLSIFLLLDLVSFVNLDFPLPHEIQVVDLIALFENFIAFAPRNRVQMLTKMLELGLAI